jgi:hypothetical protein
MIQSIALGFAAFLALIVVMPISARQNPPTVIAAFVVGALVAIGFWK